MENPKEMRERAESFFTDAQLAAEDGEDGRGSSIRGTLWLIAAEICERLDRILDKLPDDAIRRKARR